jgi:hypothetical protein
MNQPTPNQGPWKDLDKALRRTVASARAARGWNWEQVSVELGQRGWTITAGNLMTRHSRMAFRADEIVLLLDVLGVKELQIASLL